MFKEKQNKLEKAGFRVGSTADFLELTPEEEEYLKMLVIFSETKPDQNQD